MKATILDLRYKMKDVLKALDRNETVKIFYHGKLKGEIIPHHQKIQRKIKNHPFFGMDKDNSESVKETMDKLRGDRFHDL